VTRSVPSFEDLRSSLQAGGGDLELQGVESGVAKVRLLLLDPSCVECIVPRTSMERIIKVALEHQYPDLRTVELVDPREDSVATGDA
jgi:Fe-S cluster biogenesis protein NfuA